MLFSGQTEFSLRNLYGRPTPHVVIWRGVIVIHVTGPYFFHGNFNGVSYFETCENYVIPDLTSGEIMEKGRLQQHCAPPHFNLTVPLNSLRNFLRIGRASLSSPPAMPRTSLSPDLSTPDDSLWSILKGKLVLLLYSTNTELRFLTESTNQMQ